MAACRSMAARSACSSRSWLFCRQRRPVVLRLFRHHHRAVPIGLFFGRIANFINGELWGRPTDVPWAMVFPNAGPEPRHPSQLYEAGLEGIVLFVLLFALLRWTAIARAAGRALGRVPDRLCGRAHLRRVLPRARLRFWASSGSARPWVSCFRSRFFCSACGSCWCARPATVTAAADRLAQRISRIAGPISVADYMEKCGSRLAITRRAIRWARAGDFITAPEISQIFGELIGLWCAELWQRLGAPDPVLLVELGPGRGTLMADALRAARIVPGFGQRFTPPSGRAQPGVARQAGGGARRRTRRTGMTASRPCRRDRCCSSPTNFSTRCRSGNSSAAPRAGMSAASASTPMARASRSCSSRNQARCGTQLPRAPEGTIAELCPADRGAGAERSARASPGEGGAALFIDYGYFPSACGDTLPGGAPPSHAMRCSKSREAPISPRMSISRLSPPLRAPAAPSSSAR